MPAGCLQKRTRGRRIVRNGPIVIGRRIERNHDPVVQRTVTVHHFRDQLLTIDCGANRSPHARIEHERSRILEIEIRRAEIGLDQHL